MLPQPTLTFGFGVLSGKLGAAELLQQLQFLVVKTSPTRKPESISIQEQEGAGLLPTAGNLGVI